MKTFMAALPERFQQYDTGQARSVCLVLPAVPAAAHTCPSSKRHTTSRGLKVRSKSELLIAEKLSEHGILFRYEQILEIGGAEYARTSPSSARDGQHDILGALRAHFRTAAI